MDWDVRAGWLDFDTGLSTDHLRDYKVASQRGRVREAASHKALAAAGKMLEPRKKPLPWAKAFVFLRVLLLHLGKDNDQSVQGE